jgi:hypothetical protein
MGTDAFGLGDGLTTLPLEQPIAFFNGARLHWRRFRPWPSHRSECANCEAPFSTDGSPGLLAGYSVLGGGPAGQDDHTWICAICCEAWRDACGWVVLDTPGNPIEPAARWESAFRLVWVDSTRR